MLVARIELSLDKAPHILSPFPPKFRRLKWRERATYFLQAKPRYEKILSWPPFFVCLVPTACMNSRKDVFLFKLHLGKCRNALVYTEAPWSVVVRGVSLKTRVGTLRWISSPFFFCCGWASIKRIVGYSRGLDRNYTLID